MRRVRPVHPRYARRIGSWMIYHEAVFPNAAMRFAG